MTQSNFVLKVRTWYYLGNPEICILGWSWFWKFFVEIFGQSMVDAVYAPKIWNKSSGM